MMRWWWVGLGGFLGGSTTFSIFGYETVVLLRNEDFGRAGPT